MKALPYIHPKLYQLFLLLLHRKNLVKRYTYLSREIGRNKVVFELGCGIGILAKYLDKSCEYMGWDLNATFIKYLRKMGLNAELKDIFNFKEYPENDITVIIDVLHHVAPKERILIQNALKTTKKLIVVEPSSPYKFGRVQHISRFYYFYDLFLGDNDGINPLHRRISWNFSEKDLKNYFISLGASKINYIGKDVVAIFHSNGKVSEIEKKRN